MSVKQSKLARLASEAVQVATYVETRVLQAVMNIDRWSSRGYPLSQSAFQAYVQFVYQHADPKHPGCEYHHVFPKSLFPELQSALWNLVPLPPEHHFTAHALLTDLVPSCDELARAFMGMCGRRVVSHKAREAAAKQYAQCRAATTKQLQVRLDSHIVSVERHDPRVLSGELKHFNTGKPSAGPRGRVVVLGRDGVPAMVAVDDPRYLSGAMKSVNADTVTVVGVDGRLRRVATSDPQWQAGSLKHMNAGTVSVRDPETGECFRVSTQDPRWLAGALVHRNKGTFPARSVVTGETLRISKTDPRYLSGEFVHVNKRTTHPTDVGAPHHVD